MLCRVPNIDMQKMKANAFFWSL